MTLIEKLMHIQSELKAPKGQFNSFGKYNYRNCEDILEALKPIMKEVKVVLMMHDVVEQIGNRYYVKAIVKLYDCESSESLCVEASAREEESKKGMDGSQVTGASSSYARKYALNGMFCIDDTKDSDSTNDGKKDEKPKDTPHQNSDLISEPQAKRLFAISQGKNEIVKEIIVKFGYASSKEIKKKDYDAICKEIEAKVSVA